MPLSKSTFIRGLDCPVRIQLVVERLPSTKEYDEFLRLLAEGGFQFERLVRHAWPGREIRGDIRRPQQAHEETIAAIRELLAAGGGCLHEATFVHSGCAARVDMLRVTPDAIELCEIKAKSYDGPSDPVLAAAVQRDPDALVGRDGVRAGWIRYVADVAFQAFVVERALHSEGLERLSVLPRLIVVNRNAVCGTYDSFANIVIDAERCVESRRMTSEDMQWVQEPPAGYRSPLINELDVSDAVARLRAVCCQSKSQRWRGMPLDQVIEEASAIYRRTLTVDAAFERGLKCRDCEFRASGAAVPQSGFDRCWGDSARSAAELVTLYHGRDYRPASGPAAGTQWVRTGWR